MKQTTPDPRLLALVLRENFTGSAWHGPSVSAALRGVDARAALWRPQPGRNCIWEIALHLAYTRYRMLRRLTPPPRTAFPRAQSHPWWPELPATRDNGTWRADVALLHEWHDRLLDTLPHVPRRVLASFRAGQQRTRGHEVLGVATHDAYHAGQIQLMRRLGGA